MSAPEQDVDVEPPLWFYLVAMCENCEEDIFYGPCVSTLDYHHGLPVVGYDFASQSVFRCEHCGASNYTGDFELHVEGGDPQSEEKDDDDDDDDV